MREPKLIYSCPLEELVGRKVINQSGYIGIIISISMQFYDRFPIQVKFDAVTLMYRVDGYYRLRTDEDWIKFADETANAEMTTNQTQTEEPRIAEIRRKAEKAHTLFRHSEGIYYKIDYVKSGFIRATTMNDLYDSFSFALEDIDAEDKFFELTEIK